MWLLRPPGVYVPQADTALLAESVRREGGVLGKQVLDLCTGSGALAVEAARSGAARVTAVDVSVRAVVTARCNVLLRGLPVDVVRGDLTAPVRGRRFDLVLSNPPYVPCPAPWPPRRGTPGTWAGGRDGRRLLDRLCRDVPPLLTPGGTLLLVHSALAGEETTLRQLAEAGMKAEVTARRRVPFGPVLRSGARWLEAHGLVERGEREEEVVVVRAERPE